MTYTPKFINKNKKNNLLFQIIIFNFEAITKKTKQFV